MKIRFGRSLRYLGIALLLLFLFFSIKKFGQGGDEEGAHSNETDCTRGAQTQEERSRSARNRDAEFDFYKFLHFQLDLFFDPVVFTEEEGVGDVEEVV